MHGILILMFALLAFVVGAESAAPGVAAKGFVAVRVYWWALENELPLRLAAKRIEARQILDEEAAP